MSCSQHHCWPPPQFHLDSQLRFMASNCLCVCACTHPCVCSCTHLCMCSCTRLCTCSCTCPCNPTQIHSCTVMASIYLSCALHMNFQVLMHMNFQVLMHPCPNHLLFWLGPLKWSQAPTLGYQPRMCCLMSLPPHQHLPVVLLTGLKSLVDCSTHFGYRGSIPVMSSASLPPLLTSMDGSISCRTHPGASSCGGGCK